MIEIATRLPKMRCPKCEKPPLHVFIRGKNKHVVECPRCRSRTAPADTLELAKSAWKQQQIERMPLRAVA